MGFSAGFHARQVRSGEIVQFCWSYYKDSVRVTLRVMESSICFSDCNRDSFFSKTSRLDREREVGRGGGYGRGEFHSR